MYLIIFAIVMLFAGLTSIVLVMNSKNYWVHAFPPSVLWMSNLLVVLSSVTLFLALRSARMNNKGATTALLLLTFALGIGFTFTQSSGWRHLSSKGMGVTVIEKEPGVKQWKWNNLDQLKGVYGVDYDIRKSGQILIEKDGEFYLPSDQSFTKPVTNRVGETFNASGAMICVLIFLHIFHLGFGLIYLLVLSYRSFRGRIHSANWISLYSGGMYWHFMGVLWIYLFFFLFYMQ